jgi:E3 ubiquitin-protein ligase MGRN1
LKLVPCASDPSRLVVQFQFDAAAAGSVSCFFNCTENVQEACKLSAGLPVAPRVAFEKGLGQSYRQEAQWGLPLNRAGDAGHQYGLVVRLETITKEAPEGACFPQPAGSPLPKWVQAQTTYATITRDDEGELVVRVLKQKIWVDAVSYELQEIYGIEQCSSTATGSAADEQGKECVICLSEPRDTTVLPCRHMCMCSGCARMLRHQTNRCPICRTTVEGLLEIKVERRAT